MELEEKEQSAINKVQCGGCEKYFVSYTCFEMHRVGVYKDGTRRCMTDEEMQSAGMATETRLVTVRHGNKKMREEHEAWYHVESRDKGQVYFSSHGRNAIS